MDQILIEGLLLRCVIGCRVEERRDVSDVVVDMTIGADASVVGFSDDPADMWDYRAVTKAVLADVAPPAQFFTVEALATRIARTVILDGKAPWAMVRVRKPGALRFANMVGIEIRRHAADFAVAQGVDAA